MSSPVRRGRSAQRPRQRSSFSKSYLCWLPNLEEALARAGFAALIYWSPVMRDLRLDPEVIENIALAYHWLLEQPYVDPGRSGLIGTCVGGSFALMAAASPLLRDRVAFVGGFAPYASMWT